MADVYNGVTSTADAMTALMNDVENSIADGAAMLKAAVQLHKTSEQVRCC